LYSYSAYSLIGIERESLLAEFHTLSKKRGILSFHYWNQKAFRDIPPVTTQNFSHANQKDASHRALIKYQKQFHAFNLESKISYFNETQLYRDPSISLASQNDYQTLFGELGIKKQFLTGNHYYLGFSYNRNLAETTNYDGLQSEDKFALFSFYRWHLKHLTTQFSVRQELIDNSRAPFIPSFTMSWKNGSSHDYQLKIKRNFRNPTLNDRFWFPGGHPSLEAESGWSQELNYAYQSNDQHKSLSINASVYNRLISDWILWTQSENSNFFSPRNIAKVWSRGFEFSSRYKVVKNKSQWEFQLDYQFTKSTNEIGINDPFISKGSQLLYTPIHTWRNQIKYGIGSINATLNHTFASKSEGINEAIDPYILGDLNFALKLNNELDKRKNQFYFRIRNLYNLNYRIIERRPMPGRNIELGIELEI